MEKQGRERGSGKDRRKKKKKEEEGREGERDRQIDLMKFFHFFSRKINRTFTF